MKSRIKIKTGKARLIGESNQTPAKDAKRVLLESMEKQLLAGIKPRCGICGSR